MAGVDPRLQALQFFTARGYSPAQAAGIVGNLVQESGRGLNTRAVHDGGTGLGIAGWRDPQPGQGRRTELRNFAAAQGADVHDLATQLGFVDHELRGPESRVGAQLRRAQDPVAAARAFISYERPAGWAAATPERGHGFQARAKNATELYAAFGDGSVKSLPPELGGAPGPAAPGGSAVPSLVGQPAPTQLGDAVANMPGILMAQEILAQSAAAPFQNLVKRQEEEAKATQERRKALFAGGLPGLYG